MQEDPETGFFEHRSLTLSLLASENDQCHKSAYEHVLGMLWGPRWPVPGWVQKQPLALIDRMLCSEMSCPWLPSFSPISPLIQASGPHFPLVAQYFGSIRLFISNTNPQNHIPQNKSAHFCFYKRQHPLSSSLSTRTWSALWCPFPASVPPAQLTVLLPSLSL